MGTPSRGLYYVIAGLALVVLTAGVWFGLRSFQQYQAYQTGEGIGIGQSAWIGNPQPGSQFPVGSQVIVEAGAEGLSPIRKVELWSDASLVGVQRSETAAGLGGLPLTFSWQADELGSYLLFVRAFTEQGGTFTSGMREVEIVPPDQLTVENIADNYMTSSGNVPSANGGGSDAPGEVPAPLAEEEITPYNLPDPEEIPSDAPILKTSNPTVLGWLQDLLPDEGAPVTTPQLVGMQEGCTARLGITASSVASDGFRVYRRDDDASDFKLIDTLPPHPGIWTIYEDEGQYGTLLYYVSLFNSNGENPSNVVEVQIEIPDCQPVGEASLPVDLGKIFPESLGSNRNYCYYNLGGLGWQRHPAGPSSFLPSSAEAKHDILEIVDPGQETTVDLECWGWPGGSLTRLGRWHWEDIRVMSGGGQPPDSQVDIPGIDSDIDVSVDDDVITGGYDGGFELKYDYRIPKPFAWWSSEPQVCADYGGIPNPIIKGLICGDVADDIDFVVWVLENECPLAQTFDNVTCFTEQDIVGYRVYDTLHNAGATPVDVIDAPRRLYFLVEETSCAARNVWISALVEVNGELEESVPGNIVYYPGNPDCPFLLGQATRDFTLSWDTIDFSVGNIDDGVDIEDDAEGYGYLKLQTTSGFKMYWGLSETGHSVAGGDFDIEHVDTYEFDDDDGPNPYAWSGIPLAKNSSGPCLIYLGCSYSTGNHAATFPMYVTDTAYVTVRLWDADPSHPDDKICYTGSFTFGSSTVDLAGGTLQGSLSANHSSADCLVRFHINAGP